MARINVISDKDFILLESPYQLIAILGSELKLTLSSAGVNLENSLNLLYSFIESARCSAVFRFTHRKTEVFFLLSSSSYDSLVISLTELQQHIVSFNNKHSEISLSLYNHIPISKSIEYLLTTSIKKTPEPKIINIDNNYWIVGSLDLHSWANVSSLSKYFKDLISLPQVQLSIHYKFSTRNFKPLRPQISILMTFSSTNLSDAKRALKHISEVSSHYKDFLSCRILFHSYKELKNSRLAFVLGLSKIKIHEHSIDEIIDGYVLLLNDSSTQELMIKNSSPSSQSLFSPQIPLNSDANNSNLPNEVNTELNSSPSMLVPSNSAHNKAETLNASKISKKNGYKPIIPYGKEVSEDEIKRLLKTIPSPPS